MKSEAINLTIARCSFMLRPLKCFADTVLRLEQVVEARGKVVLRIVLAGTCSTNIRKAKLWALAVDACSNYCKVVSLDPSPRVGRVRQK